MALQRIFLTLFLFAFPALLMAQSSDKHFTSEWKQVDKYLNDGLPQSARKEAEKIYQKARAQNLPVQALKAQIYLLETTEQAQEENGDSIAVARAEGYARTEAFPYNAIWHSIAGTLYRNYYQSNRWQIFQRTRTSTLPEDFQQWDATRFVEAMNRHFKASVQRPDALKAYPIAQFDPILETGVNTRSYRPTLYDLLAFRAVDYFSWEQKDLPKTAGDFRMNDAALLSPATVFMNHRFATGDTTSPHYNAILLYQDILKEHAADAQKDAFLDADLQRLEFAYRNASFPDKKKLYENALADFVSRYDAHPLSALAAYRLALSKWTSREVVDEDYDDGEMPDADTGNALHLKYALETIVRKFPKSEGGILAAQYLQNLQRPSLSMQAEEAVLPGKPSKVLLNYKATPKVWLRVVKLDNDFFKNIRNRQDRIDAAWLGRQKAVAQWSVNLPKSDDLEQHRTELKIGALPVGVYGLFYSTKESFSGTDNDLSYVPFTVTTLSVITQSGNDNAPSGYVLNRETGAPVAGATVTAYQQKWESSGYVQNVLATATSQADGSFDFKSIRNISGLSVAKGSDVFYNQSYYDFYRNERPPYLEVNRAFFFTDRSIYRPGQSIFFKAIALKQSDNNRKAEVLSGKELTITFFDANHQKIAEQKLTTNEFGSVTGTFNAPQTGLTGSMSIEARLDGRQVGSTNVQVEEYKRPKFFVQPDSLKDVAYALNENVKLTLKALSYSGAAVDGAQVKYRVVRRARMPYWWRWGGPTSPQVELTQGTTTTRPDGSFDVSFFTLPDEKLPEGSLPVFSYTVYADVSDQNGETHTAQQTISASYRALELLAQLPEQTTREALDTISVNTQNLAGKFLPATVKLKIDRLQTPDVVYRKRLWETPDAFVMSEAEFRAAFPNDAYKNEDDYHHWKTAETVHQSSFTTTGKGTVALPDVFRKNGWYVFTFSTTDKNGKAIEQKQYVHVWAGESGGRIALPLMAVPESQTVQPGEKAQVVTASAWPQQHVLEQPDGIALEEKPNWFSLANGVHSWTKNITEADRGGRSLQYVMVRDNRVYTQTATIAIPWSNKDLDLSWETHRDKVQPGAAEEWTLVIRGAKKDKVAAELAAVLYDASLDAFLPHAWYASALFATHYPSTRWNTQSGFGIASEVNLAYPESKQIDGYEKRYDALKFFGTEEVYMYMESRASGRGGGRMRTMSAAPTMAKSANMEMADAAAEAPPAPQSSVKFTPPVLKNDEELRENEVDASADVPLRKNLQETAFFMPQLTTDASGAVRLKFTFPEALTEWKFMAFAHTKDLQTGSLSGTVKTQKDLMVVPGLPRFFRQGDELQLSAKITNMTAAQMAGNARIEIVDALTGQSLNTQFGLSGNTAAFTTAANGSTTATWKLNIPRSRYEPVLVRLSAQSGAFTDGEENMLPVITNRMLVTETLPLWMNGVGEKTVQWDKLLASGNSGTLGQHALTVEYTTNPAWYAVQALPYLMEYPHECAEQTFNRYYATALAAHIVKNAPRVKEIFNRWRTEDTAALLSNLEKNPELKSALLAETPWVLEAQSETQQKKNIARLFETVKLARELDNHARKLEDMLLPEGGFPWFKGDTRPDRYITQYIVTGIGRLQKLGVTEGSNRMQRIADKCLPFLDRKIAEDYQNLVKYKANLTQMQVSPFQVQYLYMRTFFGKLPQGKEVQYYAGQAKKFWPNFNAYIKGMTGLFAKREGDAAVPEAIYKSLLETSTYKEEMGRYWNEPGRSWWWHEAPIEAQALLIEFFTETDKKATIDESRRWLLKQKQTQHWKTTKATADACYALLRTGTEWLNAEPQVTILVGDRTLASSQMKTEAGTGYIKVRIPGAEVKPEMGRIKFAVSNGPNAAAKLPDGMPTWGGVYWQYFEDLDKITAAQTPLQIKKQLWVEEATPRGKELRPLNEGDGLKVGDRVKARIEIIVDRDMEYVHLKDARASCFEPLNVLSQYKWQGGLGYYESTLDVSSNFFISYLPKGKYVFEYPMFATQSGNFSAGLATIQCMYAPEFSAHTEGVRVKVDKR